MQSENKMFDDFVKMVNGFAGTMAMKVGRLSLAALASLAAGAAVSAVAPAGRPAPWIAGGIVLALFLPVHIHLWSKFPAWYHLTFLLSIVPLFAIGAGLWSRAGKSDAMQR